MGSREVLANGDPYSEATELELWASGELADDDAGGTRVALAGVMTLLVALAVFFIAFAPGV